MIASASSSGKTTVGRTLASRLDVPFVELDALNHGPGWTEATGEELRARVEPIVAGDAWVIDGGYRNKLGDLVLAAADTVVWLDLPRREWVPRLVRRTIRRTARPFATPSSGGTVCSSSRGGRMAFAARPTPRSSPVSTSSASAPSARSTSGSRRSLPSRPGGAAQRPVRPDPPAVP